MGCFRLKADGEKVKRVAKSENKTNRKDCLEARFHNERDMEHSLFY